MCETCEKLKRKVMPVDVWLAEHRDHGDLSSEPFPHPSGAWHTLVCSCGAKMVMSKGDDEKTQSELGAIPHPGTAEGNPERPADR